MTVLVCNLMFVESNPFSSVTFRRIAWCGIVGYIIVHNTIQHKICSYFSCFLSRRQKSFHLTNLAVKILLLILQGVTIKESFPWCVFLVCFHFSYLALAAVFGSMLRVAALLVVPLSSRFKVRDWSLITGRGGGYKMGKSRVRNFLRPPTQDGVKLFAPPLLKSGNFSHPPYNMAKTSSYCVKTTPKLVVPPLQHG